MATVIVTRNKWDRLRYAVLLEVILLACVIPMIMLALDKGLGETTLMGVFFSAFAMLYAIVFNYAYDYVDVSLGNIPTERSYRSRIMHAASFELTMVIICLPVVMWWMNIDVMTALLMDIGMTMFVMCLTFFYTLAYDKLFPISQLQTV